MRSRAMLSLCELERALEQYPDLPRDPWAGASSYNYGKVAFENGYMCSFERQKCEYMTVVSLVHLTSAARRQHIDPILCPT